MSTNTDGTGTYVDHLALATHYALGLSKTTQSERSARITQIAADPRNPEGLVVGLELDKKMRQALGVTSLVPGGFTLGEVVPEYSLVDTWNLNARIREEGEWARPYELHFDRNSSDKLRRVYGEDLERLIGQNVDALFMDKTPTPSNLIGFRKFVSLAD